MLTPLPLQQGKPHGKCLFPLRDLFSLHPIRMPVNVANATSLVLRHLNFQVKRLLFEGRLRDLLLHLLNGE
jgi:hypothetical protein